MIDEIENILKGFELSGVSYSTYTIMYSFRKPQNSREAYNKLAQMYSKYKFDLHYDYIIFVR